MARARLPFQCNSLIANFLASEPSISHFRVDSVMLGTVKQAHRSDTVITDADREQIWDAYIKLHPAFAVLFLIKLRTLIYNYNYY